MELTSIAEKLTEQVEKLLKNQSVTLDSVLLFIPQCMDFINKLDPNMPGREKKHLVISVVERAVRYSDQLNDTQMETLKSIMPTLIDTFVDIYKHKYVFISVAKKGSKIFKNCMKG